MKSAIVLIVLLAPGARAQNSPAAVELAKAATTRVAAAHYGETEELCRHAIVLWKQAGRPTPDWAVTLGNLGSLHHAQADFAQAETCYREALAMLEGLVPAKDVRRARLLIGLGRVYLATGRLRQAKHYIGQGAPLCEESPEDLATATDAMGTVLEAEGSLGEAERCFRRALALREQSIGPSHPHTAEVRANLGYVLRRRGDLAGAEAQLGRALEDYRRARGEEHPSAAALINNLGQIQQERGEWKKAMASFETAIALWRKSLGREHPYVASGLVNLAALYQTRKQYRRAQELLQEAFAILKKHYPPGHARIAMTQNNLASLAFAQRRYDTAEQILIEEISRRPHGSTISGVRRNANFRPAWSITFNWQTYSPLSSVRSGTASSNCTYAFAGAAPSEAVSGRPCRGRRPLRRLEGPLLPEFPFAGPGLPYPDHQRGRLPDACVRVHPAGRTPRTAHPGDGSICKPRPR